LFHPEALLEMVAEAEYYEEKEQLLGKRFLNNVQAAIRAVERNPTIFQVVEDDCRRCRVKHFPVGVVFREGDSQLEIIGIVPFRKKPGYWHHRIKAEPEGGAESVS
jgi:hypothetical protein